MPGAKVVEATPADDGTAGRALPPTGPPRVGARAAADAEVGPCAGRDAC